MPTETAGDESLTGLLRDEITFHKLFERFIRNFYRMHLAGYDVGSEQLQWHDELGSDLVPAMFTDVSIVQRASPFRRLIVDTNYSVSTFCQSAFGTPKFKSDNLYQIYSYLRTQANRSEAHRIASGFDISDKRLRRLRQYARTGHRITISISICRNLGERLSRDSLRRHLLIFRRR